MGTDEEDEESALARAIAMSMENEKLEDKLSRELTDGGENEAKKFLTVASETFDTIVRMKKIDADNSCLFNSIGFCIEQKLDSNKYRYVVSREIAKNKCGLWTDAVLGKPAHIYVRWIRDPKNWGGEIEMSILSKHLELEIVAFSVQTCKMTLYGKGFDKRIYLLYSGIHYDAVVCASSEKGIFASNDVRVLNAVQALVEKLHKQNRYVNLAGFKLQCMQCRKELRGQKEAGLHASETGHSQFGQIS